MTYEDLTPFLPFLSGRECAGSSGEHPASDALRFGCRATMITMGYEATRVLCRISISGPRNVYSSGSTAGVGGGIILGRGLAGS